MVLTRARTVAATALTGVALAVVLLTPTTEPPSETAPAASPEQPSQQP